MPTPDRALALSAVETEQLRDMRNRLGRRAVSPAAQATRATGWARPLPTRARAAVEPRVVASHPTVRKSSALKIACP